MKKLMSIFLTGAMVLTMVPFASIGVSAAETSPADGIYKIEEREDYWAPVKKALTSVEVASDSKPDFIYSGDTYYFDTTDLKFNVSFSDGKTADFAFRSTYLLTDDIEEFNDLIYKCEINTNTAEATFTMRGKNQASGVSVTVPVNPLEVESITVEKEPEAGEYVAENYNHLNTNGLELNFAFTNGTSKIFKAETYSYIMRNVVVSYDSEDYNIEYCYFIPTAGDNEISLSFGECSTSFNIFAKAVESIKIQKLPTLTNYIAGDKLYYSSLLKGMEVLVSFEDGTSKVLNDENDYYSDEHNVFDCEISGLNEDYCYEIAEGDNQITLTYGGKTDTFTVTGHVLESIEITKEPDRTRAAVDSLVRLYNYSDDIEITAHFTDGTNQVYCIGEVYTEYFSNINYTAEDLIDESYIIAKQGENVITLDLGGFTDEFVIIGCEVESIEIVNPPKNDHLIAGVKYGGYEAFWGFELKVTYDDGVSEIYDDAYDMSLYMDVFVYGDCVEPSEWGDESLYSCYIKLKEGDNVITLDYFGATTEVVIEGYSEIDAGWGDVNGDGTADVKDVTALQMYLAGYDVDVAFDTLDVNIDGKKDVTDVTTLQMLLAGYKI